MILLSWKRFRFQLNKICSIGQSSRFAVARRQLMDEVFRRVVVTLHLADLDVLDVLAALDDLFRGDADLPHVIACLIEMPVKFGHAIVKAEYILQQRLHLALYDACLFPHLRVLENCPDGV